MALKAIITTHQDAAQARLVRADGSCADCTVDKMWADHAGGIATAMRYYDALDLS